MAGTLTNLGTAYGKLGENAKARDVLERALAINERTYGRDHPNVAITLMNLGVAYGQLGDAAKKRKYVTRAVTILEGAYGPDHPHAAYYRNVLNAM